MSINGQEQCSRKKQEKSMAFQHQAILMARLIGRNVGRPGKRYCSKG